MKVSYGSKLTAEFIQTINMKRIATLWFASMVSLLLFACTAEDPLTSGTESGTPVIEDFGLVYVKRSVEVLGPENDDPVTVRISRTSVATEPQRYAPGGNLFIRDLSSPTAPERNITATLTAANPNDPNGNKLAGDVSDPEVSYDGKRVLFAMHVGKIENVDDEDQPYTWNIWEYDIENDTLTRLIQSDILAEGGDDVDPHYLPDGRIVFISDRNKQLSSSQLTLSGDADNFLDEQRQNPSMTLHIMSELGENIKQISMNLSNDRNPVVLNNGKIAFVRWDRAGPTNKMSIYQTNPDGSEYKPLYGVHSHDPVTSEFAFIHVRQMADGRLMSTVMSRTNTLDGGDLVMIDQDRFIEIDDARFGANVSQGEVGQTSVSNGDVNRDANISQYGRYTTPFPVIEDGDNRNRVLVSWALCRMTDINRINFFPCTDSNVNDANLIQADPLYGIYMLDLNSNTKRPVVLPQTDFVITDPIPIIARTSIPTIIPDKSVDAGELNFDLVNRNMGVIHIRSVYDTEGNVAYVDRPLQPLSRSTLMNAEASAIPMTNIQMDPVTKAITTDTSLPNLVQRRVADLNQLRDPTLVPADNRVARFVRVTRTIPAISNIPNQAYGNSGGYEMREILGYAQVEPDGSVYVEVPAGEPFTVQVLDSAGRSFTSHDAVLQVNAGETRVCNGCHSPNDDQPSINSGAPVDNTPWPNTLGNLVPRQGETMAETRARQSCFTDCAYQQLDRDIVFSDVWTDPSAATPGTDISFTYTPTNIPVSPIKNDSGACDDPVWSTFIAESVAQKCRISINYADHIHPIWEADRLFDLDNNTIDENYKCSNCHGTYSIDLETGLRNQILVDDGMGGMVLEDERRLPAGQFYFREGTTEDVGNGVSRVLSYADLFQNQQSYEFFPVGSNTVVLAVEREADGTPTVDENGQQTLIRRGYAEVRQGASNARQSHLVEVIFNQELRGAGTLPASPTFDHTLILTDGEKRLIVEWIDNGTQYYNDPALAPRVNN